MRVLYFYFDDEEKNIFDIVNVVSEEQVQQMKDESGFPCGECDSEKFTKGIHNLSLPGLGFTYKHTDKGPVIADQTEALKKKYCDQVESDSLKIINDLIPPHRRENLLYAHAAGDTSLSEEYGLTIAQVNNTIKAFRKKAKAAQELIMSKKTKGEMEQVIDELSWPGVSNE